MPIKLVAYDLDNTLFDTYGQLSKEALEVMINRMKELGLTDAQEMDLRKRYFYTGFRIIAKEIGLPQEMVRMGIDAYRNTDFSHIRPYDDIDVVRELKAKGIFQVIVTSGIEEVQRRKVLNLGLAGLFDEMMVDESDDNNGKQRIISDLICEFDLEKSEMLIVGDNPDSELAAGKRLGIKTAQILRNQRVKIGDADYHIKSLTELPAILEKL